MANYRQIHVSVWKDEWFLDLTPTEKLLFIYLFSNESASLSGIYKIALRVICFETSLPKNRVVETLQKFSIADKIHYQAGIVWVKNLRKYNRGSNKVDIRIEKDLAEIPDCELKRKYISYYDPKIPYSDKNIRSPYPMDTVSTEMKCNEMKYNEVKGNEKNPWEIPSDLDTPEFLSAWKDFQQHRKEIRKKMTPLAGKRMLKKLNKHSPGVAVLMLERSIENGWQGVFDLNERGGSTRKPTTASDITKIIEEK